MEADLQILPNLNKLNMSHNRLTRIPAMHFLQFLETLDLKKNNITEFPAYMKDIPQLRHIDLSGNKIRVLPAEIGACPALRKLDVSDNDIHALPLELAHLNLEKGGFDWTFNPKMTFPPAEVRDLGQQGIMDWLQKQAEIEHPVVRKRKQALQKIRKQETNIWLAQMKECVWNTQEEYEEQLLRKPIWMEMDEAMATIAKERMGGGWWPEDGYTPPQASPSAELMKRNSSNLEAAAGAIVQGTSVEETAIGDIPVAVATELPESAECKICMAAAISAVFMPCGHAMACQNCAAAVAGKECPICRTPIENIQQLYWT